MSENLLEEKSSLIDLTESEDKGRSSTGGGVSTKSTSAVGSGRNSSGVTGNSGGASRPDHSPVFGKSTFEEINCNWNGG